MPRELAEQSSRERRRLLKGAGAVDYETPVPSSAMRAMADGGALQRAGAARGSEGQGRTWRAGD